jgi:hypothetical protein
MRNLVVGGCTMVERAGEFNPTSISRKTRETTADAANTYTSGSGFMQT